MIYSIRNWDEVFEKSQLRKAKTHHWVAMPIKHDGAGFRRVSIQPNACELFCAWCLIIQVAAKCPVRGLLKKDSGEAIDAEDLAIKTGYPVRIFDNAFEFFTCSKIGWLTTTKNETTTTATTKTEKTTSETEKTTSGDTHSTVQYNTRQTEEQEPIKIGHVFESASAASVSMVEEIINCRQELRRIRPEEFFKIINDTKANPRQAENHKEFIAEMVNSLKVPNNPARVYAGFMNSQGKLQANKKKNPDILTMDDIRKRGCIIC